MALLVLVGVGLGVAATALFSFRWFRDRALPTQGAPVAVSWPEGLDARETSGLLFDLGLTDNEAAMELYLRVTDSLSCIAPGPHWLPMGLTPRALLAALCRNQDRPKVKVTFPEGFHRYAFAKRLADAGVVARDAFLHASADEELLYSLGIEPAELPEASTAEGYLFPATYHLPIDSEPHVVVRRLVGETNLRWKRLTAKYQGGWERLQAELGLDRRAVVTLASMVEKEAAVAEERPIIASVFLNRLRNDDFARLQSDPTALYGCLAMPEKIAACDQFDGKASGALNRDVDNVYSTYVTKGLPPGPIANPGAASVEAVLNPAETSYLFFVAKGKGRHAFSESYDEHNAAVKRLREMRTQ